MPEIHYKRLTRSRARSVFAIAFQSRASLWLGPDHLLSVDTNGYSETYKRLYFRDIQAIAIRESPRRSVWNAILMLPTVICFVGLVITALAGKNIAGIIIWSLFFALVAIPFVVNNVRGATCACQLRTAVQTEDLPSLCRVRQTRKILEKIRPLIAAAQGGELPAETVAARMRDWAAAPAGEPPANPVPDEPDIPPRLAP
jgi:hypothetical protein